MLFVSILFVIAVIAGTDGATDPNQTNGLKASCLEIYTENPDMQSGNYIIANGGSNQSVFCEFHEGYGITFISRLNDVRDNPIDIDLLANVKGRTLIRTRMMDGVQKDSLLFQLDDFKNKYNLSVQFNSANNYQTPQLSNKAMWPYIYLGFLPEVEASQKTKQGYKAENKNFYFHNCDGNGNSYFAFYFNPNNVLPTKPGNNNDLMEGWLNVAQLTMTNNNLADDFFFPFEIHMGGCGGFAMSTAINVDGASLGLLFEVMCEQLPNVQNAIRHGDGTAYGSIVTYECEAPHQLSNGDLTRRCEVNGMYNGSSPVCEIVCNDPPDVQNATVSGFPTAIGNYVTYECNKGYSLVNGTTTLQCEGTGFYRGQTPICNKIVCNDPPDVQNATVSGFPTAIGNYVTYECNKGYSLVNGTTTLQCEGTGFYRGQTPICNKTTTEHKKTKCFCDCSLLRKVKKLNMTEEEREQYIESRIKEIRADMKIPRKNISSVIRRKISAPDSRVSAQTYGYLGIAILICVFGTTLLLDLSALRRDFGIMLDNLFRRT